MRDSELELSERIQNLLFPSGILWDKEIGDYRTIDENQALALMRRISESYKNKKKRKILSKIPLLSNRARDRTRTYTSRDTRS
mgnify:CR=1 FL=1